MPCLYYVPTKGVVAEHASQFVGESEVQLCFSMAEAPDLNYDDERNEERAWSGRPCTTFIRENLELTIITAPISVKEKAKWVEFIRSTRCETLRIDTKSLPVNCWSVNEECAITGTPSISTINKLYFSVSFTLLFWGF